MCGIAGLVAPRTTPLSPGLGEALLATMHHRGPNDHGTLQLVRGKVELGRGMPVAPQAEVLFLHKRLSILDLSELGWQPMGTPDGRYFVTYNGEIYNFIELREELERLGRTFRSRSDTEVLLQAYAEWGPAALRRLVGMFAFALLDTQERAILLCRDFFGIKPLYYTAWNGGLAFASEIKTLLELPGVPRQTEPSTLFRYLRWGTTSNGDRTILDGIHQLLPGQYLRVSLDQPLKWHTERYWSVDASDTLDLSFSEAAQRMRELFLESIKLHLRSDVPIGAALSGGTDSSSVVMAMRQVEPRLDLHSFTYVATGFRVDEARWAGEVSRAARTVDHRIEVDPEEMLADLDAIIHAQDEPFGSTNMIAQYNVFKRARREGVTVMLNGQGADELLGGYAHYRAARLASLLREGKWLEGLRFFRGAAGWDDSPAGLLAMQLGEYVLPPSLADRFRALVGKDLVPAWINRRWLEANGLTDVRLRKPPRSLRELLTDDLTTTMLQPLLRYEDRNSMAHSIECRVPFLTPQLAEFSFRLPERYLIAEDGATKAVFRAAMRGITPDAILDRREKIGFETPDEDWMRRLRPWVDQHLEGKLILDLAVLDADAVRASWSAIVRGDARFSKSVWRWMNLLTWCARFGVAIP